MSTTTVDVKSFGKVAVLMGGSSAERDVSLMSGQGVLQALRSQGVDAHAFDPYERDLGDLKKEGFQRCFIALHGRRGEDGTVQGALELLRIPYTGPGVMASAIAMDKIMTKRIWHFEGLPTPQWRQARSIQECEQAFRELGGPIFVKAAREGSSIGVMKVTELAQCKEAFEMAGKYDSTVLCEQFIDGEETTCPILVSETGVTQALPMIRIQPVSGNYDYQTKYFRNDTTYLCPSQLPAEEETRIQALAKQAFDVLGCRGWSRVDVMIRRSDRQPFLLEINTSPGMTDHSLVPMAARVAGLSYEQLCVRLLSLARLDEV